MHMFKCISAHIQRAVDALVSSTLLSTDTSVSACACACVRACVCISIHLQEVPFAEGAYASHYAVLLRCDAPELCCCVFFGGGWG